VEKARRLRTFTGHTAPVRAIAASADGKWLVSASEDRTVKVWEMTPAPLPTAFPDHPRSVYSLAWQPEGNWFATWDGGGRVRIWDRKTQGETEMPDRHSGSDLSSKTWAPRVECWVMV
jgi:WD40 repeat protein